jgi:hypothetical protein
MTGRAECGRVVTESAHAVRPTGGIVAPEGSGQNVPTLGGGNLQGLAGTFKAKKGSHS